MSNLLRKSMEYYKGRHIGCAPGTHAELTSMIGRHVIPRGAVLDIGAYSGALLLRLADLGFSQLTGIDLNPVNFAVPGAEFKCLELNEPFSSHFDRKFQLITATDVIEHLDNPRAFLKESRSLLEDDGWLAVSMPNVASWQGRIKFLLKGELWGFGEKKLSSTAAHFAHHVRTDGDDDARTRFQSSRDGGGRIILHHRNEGPHLSAVGPLKTAARGTNPRRMCHLSGPENDTRCRTDAPDTLPRVMAGDPRLRAHTG